MGRYKTYLGETTDERAVRLKQERRKSPFDRRLRSLRRHGCTAAEAYYVACREYLPEDPWADVQARIHRIENARPGGDAGEPEDAAPALTPLEVSVNNSPKTLKDVPPQSKSLVDDVLWVNDNMHANCTSEFGKPPPSRAALQQLIEAQKDPGKFREKFVLPLTKKESDATATAEAQQHDRNLGRTLQRCIAIARESLREARTAGELLESPVAQGIA